jgi:hypothetical protein
VQEGRRRRLGDPRQRVVALLDRPDPPREIAAAGLIRPPSTSRR